MGKKSRRIRDKNSGDKFYTKGEKVTQITTLKMKIQQLSLDALFPEIFEQLFRDMENYVNKNIEFYYEKRLETAKRTLRVCLKNKKRFAISVSLPHDDNH